MVKETLLWVFGYRQCPGCDVYSNAGWPDEHGVWHCEECQVNCMIDLFGNDLDELPRNWWPHIIAGARYACSIPIKAGCVLGTTTWSAAKVGSTSVFWAVRTLSAAKRPSNLAVAGPDSMTAEVFDDSWLVVVDGREGRLSVGDPVQILEARLKGVIRGKKNDMYYVEDDSKDDGYWVSTQDVRLDRSRAKCV
eukprot:TRINITY_DN27801_c0_g1_i1.p1 TRINITY_DN27801_c0_g1~~TRINITY_DN27801_c0_g1_i1.p1  ORF type:complete len:193 (+),score=28.22 TRINITY_DN27801_c0_g1_i1:90-668(+)